MKVLRFVAEQLGRNRVDVNIDWKFQIGMPVMQGIRMVTSLFGKLAPRGLLQGFPSLKMPAGLKPHVQFPVVNKQEAAGGCIHYKCAGRKMAGNSSARADIQAGLVQ